MRLQFLSSSALDFHSTSNLGDFQRKIPIFRVWNEGGMNLVVFKNKAFAARMIGICRYVLYVFVCR